MPEDNPVLAELRLSVEAIDAAIRNGQGDLAARRTCGLKSTPPSSR